MDQHGHARRAAEVGRSGAHGAPRRVAVKAAREDGRQAMKATLRTILALTALLSTPCLIGCGAGEQPAAPQQLEEMRQRDMERAKAFQREG